MLARQRKTNFVAHIMAHKIMLDKRGGIAYNLYCKDGSVAQQVERLAVNQNVKGSSPFGIATNR